MFGDIITEPDTLYFLSLPQYPKDSLVVYLGEAVQKGEIVTAPVEHTPLFPEAVELLPQDYVPALIKAGYTTYTDVAIKAYAQSLGNSGSSHTTVNNPFEYQRQRAILLEKLKEAVEKFDLNRTYYLRSQFHTNVYDFTRSGYPASSASLQIEQRPSRSEPSHWVVLSTSSMGRRTSDCSQHRTT